MTRLQNRAFTLIAGLGLVLMFVSGTALAQYQLTNLVSNQVGAARHTDPLLVNAWGLVYAPGSPFWISDNGSGWSTLYDGTGGKVPFEVEIPSANGSGAGSPTGIVYNGLDDFQGQGWGSIFFLSPLTGPIGGGARAPPPKNPH